MTKAKKILIAVPSKTTSGGVMQYCSVLRKHFSSDVNYIECGARFWPHRQGIVKETIRGLSDIAKFVKQLSKKEICLIQTNTTFGHGAVLRDGIFMLLAGLFGKKRMTFVHGWIFKHQYQMERYYFKLFKLIFFKIDAFAVLTSYQEKTLRDWGYKGVIYRETTLIEDELVIDVHEDWLIEKLNRKKPEINLLFLARVEKEKGVYEALEAFSLLKPKFPGLRLTIAGEGFELEGVKEMARVRGLVDVDFPGFVSGKQKIDCYKNAHIYIFPSYREGMPNSVLEAMGFGLPIVSTEVGALGDILENGVNGVLVSKENPGELVAAVEAIVANRDLMLKMSLTNFKTAHERYLASKVGERLMSIYQEIIQN